MLFTKSEALKYAAALTILETAKELKNNSDTVSLDDIYLSTIEQYADDSIQFDEAASDVLDVIIDVLSPVLDEKDSLIDLDDIDLDAIAVDYAKGEFDEIELDTAMPARRVGYHRELVVRDGKKVWVNKRNKCKRVVLTPKQKIALMKARLKSHNGRAKIKREKSLKFRKRAGLDR